MFAGTNPHAARAAGVFRGNVPEAVEHLEQAILLLPDSMAAWSMLAAAYNNAGKVSEFDEALAVASSKTAGQSDDYLFLGLAQSMLDPAAGLESLDRAVKWRGSVLSQLVRAEILRMQILDVPDREQARLVMSDMQSVTRQAPESAMLLALNANVNLCCYHVFGDLGETQLRQQALEAGLDAARKLANYKASDKATVVRWIFLKEVGRPPADLDDLLQASTRNGNAAAYAAAELYRRGRFEQALAVVEPHAEQRWMALIRAIVAMETHQGPAIIQSIDADNAANPPKHWDRFNAQLILRFLGRLDEAFQASRQFLAEPQGFPPVRQEAFRRALEYCAGRKSERELVTSLQGQRADLVNAHLSIALTNLAEGHRADAVRQLELTQATHYYDFTPYEISGMLLSRLRLDPAWPPWIPVQNDDRSARGR